MKTILNKSNYDFANQPLFQGEDLGLQRYDRFKYKEFFDLWEKQLSFIWKPQEIPMNKDRSDYELMPEHEKFLFTRNLLFQTMLDSVVARGVPAFTNRVSNLELEACMMAWQLFEVLHSFSYTYVINSIYAEPSKILDEALEDEHIVERANSVTKAYDELNNCEGPIEETIYLSLVNVYALESIRFYVSFVCSFAFAENKKMVGNAEIISLIRRDEQLHHHMTSRVLNILRTEEKEGFVEVVKKCESKALKIILDAAEEEKKWAEYIFSQGSIIGLNANILKNYIEWLTDQRLEQIGFKSHFGTSNPIGGWLKGWMGSSSLQVAPQEQENRSYKLSSSDNDLDNLDLGEIL